MLLETLEYAPQRRRYTKPLILTAVTTLVIIVGIVFAKSSFDDYIAKRERRAYETRFDAAAACVSSANVNSQLDSGVALRQMNELLQSSSSSVVEAKDSTVVGQWTGTTGAATWVAFAVARGNEIWLHQFRRDYRSGTTQWRLLSRNVPTDPSIRGIYGTIKIDQVVWDGVQFQVDAKANKVPQTIDLVASVPAVWGTRLLEVAAVPRTGWIAQQRWLADGQGGRLLAGPRSDRETAVQQKLLAVGYAKGTLNIVSENGFAVAGREPKQPIVRPFTATAAWFSPDCRYCVYVIGDSATCVDLPAGATRAQFVYSDETRIAFSEPAMLAVTAGGATRLFDLELGTEGPVSTFKKASAYQRIHDVWAMTTPDSPHVFYAAKGYTKPGARVADATIDGTRFSISPAGSHLAMVDTSFRVFTINGDPPLVRLDMKFLSQPPVWSGDGRRCVVTDGDAVYVWSADTPASVMRLPAKIPVTMLTLSEDGKHVAAVNAEAGLVEVWDDLDAAASNLERR